eukprot:4277451-Amphidinium_carterae.1
MILRQVSMLSSRGSLGRTLDNIDRTSNAQTQVTTIKIDMVPSLVSPPNHMPMSPAALSSPCATQEFRRRSSVRLSSSALGLVTSPALRTKSRRKRAASGGSR